MKTTTRILTLTFACFIACASVWAQSADDAYKNFKKYRDDKEAKPGAAIFQNMSKAGVDYLVEYPTDKNAAKAVNEMLSYGTGNLAKEKALRVGWYTQVQFEIINRQGAANSKKDAKGALAALSAAMAEGETLDNATPQTLNEWRGKIDALNDVPNGTRFQLDREKAYYNVVTRMLKNGQKYGDVQLAALVNHKDKGISNWAKQEARYVEISKTPFTLAFTTLDGKPFDSATLKGPPALYLYFFSIDTKGAAGDMDKLIDQYFEFSRRQIEFVAVSIDPESKREDVKTFVKKNKMKFPVYFDGKGKDGELAQKFGVTNAPIGFIFDAKGMMGPANYKYADLKKIIK